MTSIDEKIRSLTMRWHAIATGLEAFGAGTTSQQAVRFQLEELLPLTAARCRENLEIALRKPAAGLVSLVGMSPQTTIIIVEALRPRELLLIASEQSKVSVAEIAKWMSSSTRDWQTPRLEVAYIPPTDSQAIAASVHRWVDSRRGADASARVVIDATGGKKSMSVVAGMLAVQLGVEVVYLDSVFDPSLKMPRPGSEVIVRIDLPVFGSTKE